MKRLAPTGFFVFVYWIALVPSATFAQSQPSSGVQPAGTDSGPSASQSQAAPATEKKSAKVWTNDDISVLPNSPSTHAAATRVDPQKISTSSKSISPEKDPAWYRRQLVPLNAEIDKLDAQIAKLKAFLSGENISDPPTMHRQLIPTPQDQLKQMEAKRQADEAKMEDLLDRARHNGIEPGSLR